MREGSLEVKFPTIWTDRKAEGGRVREEKVRKKKTREKTQKKEDPGREKGVVFPVFCGPGGSSCCVTRARDSAPCHKASKT